jgi:hypothetical protein
MAKKQAVKKGAGKPDVTPKKGAPPIPVPDKSWHDSFIASYEVSGNVRLSCKQAGISRTEAYREYQTDAAFKARWDEAKENAIDVLEGEARRRSIASSDTLLIFLLKSLRPDTYRETVRSEHTGKGGGDLVQKLIVEVVETNGGDADHNPNE